MEDRVMGPGENPREVLENHRERGPKRFEYTWTDLGELTGLAPRTVQQYASKGRFDVTDLKSIFRFVREREEKAKQDHRSEFAALERQLKIGLLHVGVRLDGHVVFSLEHITDRETKRTFEDRLIKDGYVRSLWPALGGQSLDGWAKKE